MSGKSNYCAFYVAEPFSTGNLGANQDPDFNSYNLLRAWTGKDSNFPFDDAHATTYNIHDGSDWDETLKPRLRERLKNSKNIILFISQETKHSRALNEEIDHGINRLNLPVIVVYPNFKDPKDMLEDGKLNSSIRQLWNKLPIFRDSMRLVPTLHVPMKKGLIEKALMNQDLMLGSRAEKNFLLQIVRYHGRYTPGMLAITFRAGYGKIKICG